MFLYKDTDRNAKLNVRVGIGIVKRPTLIFKCVFVYNKHALKPTCTAIGEPHGYDPRGTKVRKYMCVP